MRIPIPPKPLPSPPPLAIPDESSAVAVNLASQPLCTPNDQPVTRNLNTIASPRRTAPKRRRALDEASQRDLPDMSQDTLALFPTIVREHSRAASPQRKRRVRACLAKASLISTLSASEPLRNPFLTEQPQPNKGSSKAARSKVITAGASESFQNMEPILEDMRAVDHFSGRVAARVKNKSDDMKRLKLRLVSSSQGRKFSLDFEQKDLAGRGAFSEVWQVVHRLDGCTYAVKKNITPMHTDQARWDSLQEVFALSALQNHPNVLRYYDAWFEEKGKYLYIQTEYIPGGSLYSQYVQQRIPMPAADLHSMAADLSCALCFMHSKGVAHLDVKPDNIFRSDRGLGRRSYILGDFGLACHYDGIDARTTEGDARYLRPEAMTESSRSAPNARSEPRSGLQDEQQYSDLRAGDVFSLGASLYELGVGVPLDKNTKRLCDDRESLMKMARELQVQCGSEVIGMIARRCLEPDPAMRATAEQIREMCRLGMDTNKDSIVKEVSENIELKAKLKQYESFARNLICMGEAGREYFRKYRSDMHLNLPG
ncbi:Serine/threonine protein kinase [Gracilaria domingensis]|nr:Serine/threonine protein kinase [Gracilaria domingensis]